MSSAVHDPRSTNIPQASLHTDVPKEFLEPYHMSKRDHQYYVFLRRHYKVKIRHVLTIVHKEYKY